MPDYPEYDELQNLRAADRRRRALNLMKTNANHELQRELYSLAFGMHVADSQARRLRGLADGALTRPTGIPGSPRWYRRSMTRLAARHDAISRTYRRALVDTNRAYRPLVIKKGIHR